MKIAEMNFGLWDNNIWTSCWNLSQLMTRVHMIASQRVTKKTLKFQIWLKEIFSNSICPELMEY